jgi:hypothetical protein
MAKDKDSKPTAANLTDLKDWLKAQGFKQTELDTALGLTVSNRNRAEIAKDLITHLKKSKKKK